MGAGGLDGQPLAVGAVWDWGRGSDIEEVEEPARILHLPGVSSLFVCLSPPPPPPRQPSLPLFFFVSPLPFQQVPRMHSAAGQPEAPPLTPPKSRRKDAEAGISLRRFKFVVCLFVC